MNLSDCSLSITEKKIRFELIIDRIVQFIITSEPTHVQTEQEIDLIKNIINLSLIGYPRGCNVIPFSLCPTRSMSLKLFAIKALWLYSRKDVIPTLSYDGKIVRTLIHSFLITNQEIITYTDSLMLKQVCNELRITQNTNCNLSQTFEKLNNLREISVKEQKPAIERSVFKFEPIAKNCVETAMNITRNVVELQNTERRLLMNYMRSFDETELINEWNNIIKSMTHEGAPWYSQTDYPRYYN